MKNLAIVILAAGEGTRMKSETPKVLHRLAGRPMVRWVLASVGALQPQSVFLIVGHRAEQVKDYLKDEPRLTFVEQKEQLGTGHALLQARKHLRDFRGDILVLCADTPLIASGTLRSLVAEHRRERNAATILSGEFDNPFGYGRICRTEAGAVFAIVEEKDATPEERRIREINSGIYCFSSPLLWDVLGKIRPNNKKKEYYLTDAVSILNERNEPVGAYCGVSPEEILGVNTRVELAQAETTVRREAALRWMREGVTVVDPANTYISLDAKIGRDSVLLPGTFIEGKTVIGRACVIGPHSIVRDSVIGDGSEVRASHVTESRLDDRVKIGPFAHLRPGSVLRSGAKVGNFSEVKKSLIGRHSKVNHLSYIGDSVLGEDVNVGAGTITCNYDGVSKHQTLIGDGAFIGSNTNLVAPVKVGRKTLIAAGSTVTDDVPSGMLAIARARQVNKPRKKKK